MPKIASKMKLHKGFVDEYKRRHNPIWPELSSLLKDFGIRDYAIFFDEQTDILFAVLTVDDTLPLEELKHEQVMKKWWDYMQDIMETNDDNSPVSYPLQEVFYLP